MSLTIHIVGSPLFILDTSECLTSEDVCVQICQDLNIIPAASHLFGLRYIKNDLLLFTSPSEVLSESNCTSYDFRMRYLPSITNLSCIGSSALNYIYSQVKNDFVCGKVLAFNSKRLQDEALGLGVTAMYCQMQDSCSSLKDVVKDYKSFLPKTVIKNSGLLMTSDCLKKNLRKVAMNPPGEVSFCKKMFVEEVAKRASEYFSESYPVKVEHRTDQVTFEVYDLVIQPLASKDLVAGLHLQSRKKTFVSLHYIFIVCTLILNINVDINQF